MITIFGNTYSTSISDAAYSTICNFPLPKQATLMDDKDPQKRFFHCVFTNCRGTNGALGSITPKLLASLFAKPSRRKHHYAHRHRPIHKRARIAASSHEPTTSGTSERRQHQSAAISSSSHSSRSNDTKENMRNQPSTHADDKDAEAETSMTETNTGEGETWTELT